MFRFLQRRPERAIVFKLDNEDRYRWRVVEMPAAYWGRQELAPAVVEEHCRTVLVDTIQDSYHGLKNCFKDAKHEVTQWVEPRKVSWWVEHETTGLHRCHLVDGGIVLPDTLQQQNGA